MRFSLCLLLVFAFNAVKVAVDHTAILASGSNLIQNGSFETTGTNWLTPWSLAQRTGAAGSVSQDSSTKVNGSYSARVDITQSNATPWYLQLHQGGLNYVGGQSYTISFWARASSPRNLNFVTQQDGGSYSEWTNNNVAVGTTWQQYTTLFSPTYSGTAMFSFNLAQATGQVWIDAVSFASTSSPGGVYQGVAISGVPYDMTLLTPYQQDAGKSPAIINFWRDWGGTGSVLPSYYLTNVANNGSVPMITWTPWNWDGGDQTPYSLSNIAAGVDDALIHTWTQTIKAYGGVVLIRFAHEMNGNWYSWGRQPQQYIAAWRHIHNLFVSDGATNVQWVWCPNTKWSDPASNFDQYYPGDSYVDWTALDSYNRPSNGSWLWFSQLFGSSYQDLTALSPKKIMIAETSSAEASLFTSQQNPNGYTKAQWIQNAYGTALPSMPRIGAIMWTNDDLTASEGCCDWRIESSAAAQTAYAQAVAPSSYLSHW